MADEIAKNEREIAGIDRHIRSFTRFVAESLEEVQWSFNKQWRSYFEEDFSSTGWHWSSHWQNFNSINKERCTSFSTNEKLVHLSSARITSYLPLKTTSEYVTIYKTS
ncbi:hypothetical protein RirG_094830 [Rhizophagus irregularis DAOM 197198w]|uniref:Uncharacterized protein n=1 Tax=Rhizophagus irregularis (strain DAOM 197198w) TaxID=1432141 RepID=A0A015KPR8_RHIIW|nr:hypothetical protein RirG_094830 [Rhizophagus irregularis DAOM 197198w]